MITILQNNQVILNVNKTMLNYCITVPKEVHCCFDFASIRNGGAGDDINIEFNGVTHRSHVNAKHVEKETPAFQAILSASLRNDIANSLKNNKRSQSLILRIDSVNQKAYLI